MATSKAAGKKGSAAIAPAPVPPIPVTPAAPVRDQWVRVGFFADNSCVSGLIGRAGGSFFSHMTNYVSDTWVIDARVGSTVARDPDTGKLIKVPAGVQRRPSSYLDDNEYALIVEIPATAKQRSLWVKSLEAAIGQPYDVKGIIDFLEDSPKDPNWRGKLHPFFCSALGLQELRQPGLIRPQVLPFYRDTPGSASEICLATDGARIAGYRGAEVERLLNSAGFNLAAIAMLGEARAAAAV